MSYCNSKYIIKIYHQFPMDNVDIFAALASTCNLSLAWRLKKRKKRKLSFWKININIGIWICHKQFITLLLYWSKLFSWFTICDKSTQSYAFLDIHSNARLLEKAVFGHFLSHLFSHLFSLKTLPFSESSVLLVSGGPAYFMVFQTQRVPDIHSDKT